MYTLTSMSTPNGISTGTRHQILLDILWVNMDMYTLTSMSTPNGISTGTRHLILLMDILWVRHVCILLLLCQLLMESQLAQDIQSYLWTYCG